MSKPDLLLHIGQWKTGTSSIQRILGARRPALAAQGVFYPATPGHANHVLLPASLVPVSALTDYHPANWEGIGPEARLARFRRDFAAELASVPAGTRLILLSSERFSGLLTDPARVAALRDLLAPHAGRMRVVMYLRRQDSHYASGYTQALRVADIRPPRLPEAGPEQLPHYDYAATLDLWAGIFGAAAIEPRIFEPAALKGGDVVEDFLDLCGIRLDVPADDPDRRNNASLTPGGIDLLRALGERLAGTGTLHPSNPLWRRMVDAANNHLPGSGWRPPPAEAAAFLARFATVNEAVRQRWFPDRPSLFAEAPKPAGTAPGEPAPIDAGAALDAAVTLLLGEFAAINAHEAHLQTTLGRALDRLGDRAPAIGAWRAALRAVPDYPQAQLWLAEAALDAGDHATARAHLAALIRAHPGSPQAIRLANRMAKLTP